MPSDDPAMLSISSHSGLHPDEIARRSFPTARRGVDPEAVRRYLETIAEELRSMHEREQALRKALTDAERRAADPVLDEKTLLRSLGTETGKVLQTAHETAANVVTSSERRAAELVSELGERAEADAAAIRSAAARESEEVTDGARADAVALLEATRAECRRIVREAKALRSSVLSDLTSRRRELRVQLEELMTGRDSLLEVVDAVGGTVEDVRQRVANAEQQARLAAAEAGERAELESDEDEPVEVAEIAEELEAELVSELGQELGPEFAPELALAPEFAPELAPDAADRYGDALASGATAGMPGAVLVESGGLVDMDDDTTEEHAEGAARRSVDELFARIRASRSPAAEEADSVGDEVLVGAEETGELPVAEPEAVPELAPEAGPRLDELAPETAAEAVPETAPETTIETVPETTIEAPAESGAAPASAAVAVPAPESETTADALRADDEATTESDTGALGQETAADPGQETAAAPGDSDSPPEPEFASELERRATLLAPLTGELSRALKRVLQDDQNILLDSLRHVTGRPDLDVTLPEPLQRGRVEEATAELLGASWSVGYGWLGSASPPVEDSTSAGQLLAGELASEVTRLLRHRLHEALAELSESGEGGADAASAAYREWRGGRIEAVSGDWSVRAFSGGILAGSHGDKVVWVVDDDGAPCPDCDDNALAGPLAAGEEFPTGQRHPPVHPGCRCLLVASSS